MQPVVANVYCAVTQQSRNGATFYLENFPAMTGKQYRLLPHALCLLSLLTTSHALLLLLCNTYTLQISFMQFRVQLQ